MATILIVDDDEHQRLLYKEELQLEGYEVTLASSGREAIEAVADQTIDCVVLDIAMPGMDGVETLAKMLDIDRQLPIILHTAYSSYKDDFMTWAAEAYVIKSSDLTGLKEHIQKALSRRTSQSQGPEAGE